MLGLAGGLAGMGAQLAEWGSGADLCSPNQTVLASATCLLLISLSKYQKLDEEMNRERSRARVLIPNDPLLPTVMTTSRFYKKALSSSA
ncbi:hypothetical protein NDU88_007847 [Pleurodeles waltl]|uniref:Uncharacterized protein n=1 Tax=Pleurodeles waltl TaxID=8319 RepID=A0AAV7PNR5_PLEWA|nr:hypothetical protein NDU88_007847 [Pleurodeles waltl]